MESENLIIDDGSQRQEVEQIGIVSPDVGVAVFSKAFVIETVYLCNLPGFVVTTEDGHSVGVSNFECDEESDCLDGVVPAIDVIAHEEVVSVGSFASDAEELHKIVELTVNIATNSYRASNFLNVPFMGEDFLCLVA